MKMSKDPARQQFIAYMAGGFNFITFVKTFIENQMLNRRQNAYIKERNAQGTIYVANITFDLHINIFLTSKNQLWSQGVHTVISDQTF